MSIYAQFDNGEQRQFASNKGWGDIVRWVKTLSEEEYPSLIHLCEHGYEIELEALEQEIQSAGNYNPPGQDVVETLHNLLDSLAVRGDADTIFVSNGLTSGDGDESDDRDSREPESTTRFDLSDSNTTTLDEITAIGTAAARRRILTAAEQIRDLAQKKTAELAAGLEDATTFEGLGKFSLLADIRAIIEDLHRGISSDLQSSMLAANFAGAAEVAVGIPPANVPPVAPSEPPTTPPTPPTIGSFFPDEPDPGLRFPVIDDALTVLHDAGIFTSDDYREVAEQAKAGAFAITSTLGDEAVADIRDLLHENIAKGPDMEAFVEAVQDRLREGNPLSERHIETIFRTNVSSAFSNGSNKSLEAPMVVDAFPYRQYWATTDQRVRETHIALEKLGLQGTNIYRADDPTWQKFRPPWDFNCRCTWNPVTVEQAARKGITEAQEWLARAKEAAKANGGEWPEWLNKTAPARGEWVAAPAFEPPPEFKRT